MLNSFKLLQLLFLPVNIMKIKFRIKEKEALRRNKAHHDILTEVNSRHENYLSLRNLLFLIHYCPVIIETITCFHAYQQLPVFHQQ